MNVSLIMNKKLFSLLKKSLKTGTVQFVKKSKRQILKFGNIKDYFQNIKSYIFIAFLLGLDKNVKAN
tara:strand:- start:1559 stop:1759 length:201 start_codon:yes stop_codon:yes gene_type:complete